MFFEIGRGEKQLRGLGRSLIQGIEVSVQKLSLLKDCVSRRLIMGIY
ncbi:MAG: hypothetical protein CM15mP58_00720 [Burkholderiaceae bacterium]|nr:MAG: hypothetical protein CM15mP58_00720 [Burkholderiaceae bacterium]